MRRTKEYLVTTDGKEFYGNFQSDYKKLEKEAVTHQKSISNSSLAQTKRDIQIHEEWVASDGTVFRGLLAAREVKYHEQYLQKLADARMLAEMFYPGEMTKEEYTMHLCKHLPRLRQYIVENMPINYQY